MRTTLQNDEVKIVYGSDSIEGLFVSIEFLDPTKKWASYIASARRYKLAGQPFDLESVVKIVAGFGFDISYELEPLPEEEPRGSGCCGGCEHCARVGI